MPRTVAPLLIALLGTALGGPSAAWGRRPGSCRRIQGERWYTCLGAVRGRAGLVAELGKKRVPSSAIDLVATLGFSEAAAPLRRLLERKDTARARWGFRILAGALVTLGVKEAAPALARLARKRDDGYALGALAKLAPTRARSVAREIAAGLNMPPSSRERSRLRSALAVLVSLRATEVLPLLHRWARILDGQQWTHRSLRRRILDARLRLGDPELWRAERRKMLRMKRWRVPSWSKAEAVLAADPADPKILGRFVRWGGRFARAVYDTVDVLARQGGSAWRKLQPKLIPVLDRATRGLERAARKRGRSAQERLLRHLIALARLGDPAARKRLRSQLIDDPGDRRSWRGVRAAVEMGLEGAANLAATLLASAVRGSYRYAKERLALLEAAVTRFGASDSRWTVALLDPSRGVRRRALYHFARLRPTAACDLVTAVVGVARRSAAEDGLLALTVLGDACRPALDRVVRDAGLSAAARGTALEILAMIRAPTYDVLADSLGEVRGLSWYLRRADEIADRVRPLPSGRALPRP